MKTSTAKARQMHDTREQGHGGNEWKVQEAVLPAFARTIAHSLGERALIVCLARQADFSEMMSLVAHPEANMVLPCDCELCVGGLCLWARYSTVDFAGSC